MAFRGAENHENPQFTHAPRRAFPTVLCPFVIELKTMTGSTCRQQRPTGQRRLVDALAVALATGGGLGRVVPAPGTVGAAVWGLPLAWLLAAWPVWVQISVVAVLACAGVPISTRACRALGGRKDPGAIVLDEIVSMPMTFFLVPNLTASTLLVGFVLNRFFDIVKPPPIRHLERLPGGLGVMADDWLAGAYSCAALHAALHFGWLPATGTFLF